MISWDGTENRWWHLLFYLRKYGFLFFLIIFCYCTFLNIWEGWWVDVFTERQGREPLFQLWRNCKKEKIYFSLDILSALQLADASRNPLELSLSLLPAPQRRDDQVAFHLLAHNQVRSVDVVHLLADALQPVLQPQHGLPQVPIRHAVQLVDGLALGFWHDFGVAIDVGDLLDFDLQSLMQTENSSETCCRWETHFTHRDGTRGYNLDCLVRLASSFWPSQPLTSTITVSKNKYKLTKVILAQVVNYFIVVFLRLLAGITHPGDCK